VTGQTRERPDEPAGTEPDRGSWWRDRRRELIEALGDRQCAYVYDLATVAAQARLLVGMRSLSRVFYAVKANPHPAILEAIAGLGLAFECVSRGEVERVFQAAPKSSRELLLFTPNFAPRGEYQWALDQRLRITVDNLHVMRNWGGMFRGREIFVRVDTGRSHGHHQKVHTAGVHSKFGVPIFELAELREAADQCKVTVTGLHAHAGSGNFAIGSWIESARVLADAATGFPGVGVLNLGGGLGVPERPGQQPLDLAAFDAALWQFRTTHPAFELWLEPGRFLVAAAGVLLARVTQLKGKGTVQYLGVATGMNSLLRPMLYDSYHEIVNLTRLDERSEVPYTVVGPICESGDVLGHARMLPRSAEGDVLLIANTGAYGHAMASHYNLRAPAEELVFGA
jgi:diaminopimelate decarboxylase/aspartate kinase